MRTLKQFKASRKFSLNHTEERRNQPPFTEGLCRQRGQNREHLAGMNEPVSSCHRSAPTTVPSFSFNAQRRLVLLLLLPPVRSSNMTRSSRVSLSKSWVWGGGVHFLGNHSSFLGRKTVGPDVSVRHVPQGTSGAHPAVERHSQGTRMLSPADI